MPADLPGPPAPWALRGPRPVAALPDLTAAKPAFSASSPLVPPPSAPFSPLASEARWLPADLLPLGLPPPWPLGRACASATRARRSSTASAARPAARRLAAGRPARHRADRARGRHGAAGQRFQRLVRRRFAGRFLFALRALLRVGRRSLPLRLFRALRCLRRRRGGELGLRLLRARRPAARVVDARFRASSCSAGSCFLPSKP